jgi:uncharacterized Zn finger protein
MLNCPNCSQIDHVEVDTHADGFASNLQECGHCGLLWTNRGDKVVILHEATRTPQSNHSQTECPICHSANRVEIDIHADGFAKNLEECGICGAVWTQERDKFRMVHGATWAGTNKAG